MKPRVCHLDARGIEYRRVILDAMAERLGLGATIAIMEHDGLRRMINAAAQSAANGATAERAAAIATAAVIRLADALDSVAAELEKND